MRLFKEGLLYMVCKKIVLTGSKVYFFHLIIVKPVYNGHLGQERVAVVAQAIYNDAFWNRLPGCCRKVTP